MKVDGEPKCEHVKNDGFLQSILTASYHEENYEYDIDNFLRKRDESTDELRFTSEMQILEIDPLQGKDCYL